MTTYLAARLGSDVEHLLGDKPLKTLRLSEEARGLILEDYRRLPRSVEPLAREWERWLKGSQPTLPVTFEQETATENPKNSPSVGPASVGTPSGTLPGNHRA